MPEAMTAESTGTATVVDGSSYIAELNGETSPEPEATPAPEPQQAATSQEPQPAEAAPVEQGQEDSAGEDDWREKRIKELAEQRKLDINDPAIRQLLTDIAVLEKRKQDTDSFADKKVEDWFSEVEKAFDDPEEQAAAAPGHAEDLSRAPVGRLPGQFEDVGKNWKSDPRDWPHDPTPWMDYQTAWGDPEKGVAPDYRKLNEIRVAMMKRDFDAFFAPGLAQWMGSAFNHFKETELDFVPGIRQAQKQQAADTALRNAQTTLKNLPNFRPLFDEMMTPNKEEPTIRVKERDGTVTEVANTPFNRIMSEFPELLEKVRHDLPPREQAREYGRMYTLAAKHLLREKRNGLTPQKAGAIMAAGAEQRQRTEEEQRVRANINKGSARGPIPTGDDTYVSELNTAGVGVLSFDEIRKLARTRR